MNEDPRTPEVGEADVEAAEAARLIRIYEQRFLTMTRESLAEIQGRVEKLDPNVLCDFYYWLDSETVLDESSKTFAGIVLGICGEEITQRFLKAHKVAGGPSK